MKRLAFTCLLLGIIVGCGATPTPEVIEKVVEKEVTKLVAGPPVTEVVKETVVVEKPVTVLVTQEPLPTYTPLATYTPRPTSVEAPPTVVPATATSAPSATPAPQPTAPVKSVVLSGSGDTATEPFVLPAPLSMARCVASGTRNFIAWAYEDGTKQDLIANDIAPYEGVRLIAGDGQFMLDVKADGPWSITIEPIATGGTPSLSGSGDQVSATFSSPATGPWEFTHSGTRNFIVKLHCTGGSRLVVNDIGPLSGSTILSPPGGMCFWEVEADGEWSLKPRE